MEQQPPEGGSAGESSALFGGAVATAPMPSTGAGGVQVTIERPAEHSRFFAIPLVGIAARYIMLIPHLVILYALGAVAGVLNLVTWIPVLSEGKYPDWGTQMVGGYLRWSARVWAYFLGLTDQYPPFSLTNESYPVQVTFDVPATSKKFWAIPVIGYLAKAVVLIPHVIALMAVLLVVEVLQLGLWVPVLFSGRFPEVGYKFGGGAILWATRVSAYYYGLTDEYPAFSLT